MNEWGSERTKRGKKYMREVGKKFTHKIKKILQPINLHIEQMR